VKIEYRLDDTHKKCTQIRGFRHKPSQIHLVNKQNRKNEKKLKKKKKSPRLVIEAMGIDGFK
jgi:hypothetical protein